MKPLSTSNDAIGQALDLTPLVETRALEPAPNNMDEDFKFARGNLLSTIMKGQEALDGILNVADMSQHPRSYEVVATLINSLTAANKDLLELTRRKQELDGNVGGGAKTINNNLFVGSTAELQKLLKKNEQG